MRAFFLILWGFFSALPVVAEVLPIRAQSIHAEPYVRVPLEIHLRSGAVHLFQVEIADEPAEHAQGLMFREHLAPNHGMLFLFPIAEIQAFWMKNTKISLDMIFLNKNGAVVDIIEKAEPLSLQPRVSRKPAIAVLEIAGGEAGKMGLKIGDFVRHPFFAPHSAP